MPKSKVDHAQALRDVRASWESRGFRADYLNAHQYEQDGDPYGELAYQRAFAEAAKKEPPRLPNPSHYPNSASAQSFLQKRNNAFYNTRPVADTPNPKYESPIPDYWRAREESGVGTPVQPQQNFMPPPPPPSQNGYAQVNGHSYTTSPTNSSSRTLPSPMEPKMGAPMGPPSRFR